MAAIDNKVVSVNATASVILAADADGVNFSIKNKAGETLFIGASDVTADTTAATGGYEVADGAEFSGWLSPSDSLYGVTASTGGNVLVIWN